MSGHSKWSKIKHKKAITDKARSGNFSKMAREITIAVKEKGADPNFNPRLKTVIEKAKSLRFPAENIKKAIERGEGKTAESALESFVFEGFGPEKTAIIIEGITDNKNRALGQIKQILSVYQVKLTQEGGAAWLFKKRLDQESGILEWAPEQKITVDEKTKESIKKLINELQENEDVQRVYHNAII